MTKDWKKDENGNWIQTWQRMEALYQKYPDKVKAIGMSSFV
jgi:glycerol 2-dehydrogenase (NADP+)